MQVLSDESVRQMGNQAVALSNKVGSGEYGFTESISLLVQAYKLELSICSGADGDSSSSWGEAIAEAQQALAIYTEAIKTAQEQAVAAMRAKGLDDFADALESGDCSALAY